MKPKTLNRRAALLLASLVITCTLLSTLAACFSPWQGHGTITINLGTGTNARAGAFPPNNDNGILPALEHRVQLHGPTGTQDHKLPKGVTNADFSVAPGLWQITVEAQHEGETYATGSGKVDVKAGQFNPVSIMMNKAIYAIGDTGPAGGIIFYDKEERSGGWRYLEAAPQDEIIGINTTIQWASTNISGISTGEAVGNGKANTAAIVTALEAISNTGKAAQLCAGKTLNGYSDWYLPSIEELELMYTNLHLNGLGDFVVSPVPNYWSSSIGTPPYVYWVRFNDGQRGSDNQLTYYCVRAVRSF